MIVPLATGKRTLRLRPYLAAAVSLALIAVLAGCSGRYASGYRGGRLQLTPGRYYPPPGPPNDPWGPYIREAASRFNVPGMWIRAVMRQESAGEAQALSPAGAMGLMQVMPSTYEMLRERYNLGSDPFEPHDNIFAGTAYIREMYDRFGAPGFLAAYNAGPNRLDDYLATGDPLPTETVNYVTAIAPRLGNATPMTGPLSVYAGGAGTYAATPVQPPVRYAVSAAPPAEVRVGGGACDPDAAYDPTRPCSPVQMTQVADAAVAPSAQQLQICDADAAYDPTHPCTPAPAPYVTTSALYVPNVPPSMSPAAAVAPVQPSVPITAGGAWAIQVGAFMTPASARTAATTARHTVPDLLGPARVQVSPTEPFGNSVLFRARLTDLPASSAANACARLAAVGAPCLIIRPSSG